MGLQDYCEKFGITLEAYKDAWGYLIGKEKEQFECNWNHLIDTDGEGFRPWDPTAATNDLKQRPPLYFVLRRRIKEMNDRDWAEYDELLPLAIKLCEAKSQSLELASKLNELYQRIHFIDSTGRHAICDFDKLTFEWHKTTIRQKDLERKVTKLDYRLNEPWGYYQDIINSLDERLTSEAQQNLNKRKVLSKQIKGLRAEQSKLNEYINRLEDKLEQLQSQVEELEDERNGLSNQLDMEKGYRGNL